MKKSNSYRNQIQVSIKIIFVSEIRMPINEIGKVFRDIIQKASLKERKDKSADEKGK